MLILFINHFSLMLNSCYIYCKTLKIKNFYRNLLQNIIICFLLSLAVSYGDSQNSSITIPLCLLLLACLMKFLYNIPLNLSIATSVISYGVSYFVFTVVATIITSFTISLFDITLYANHRVIAHIIMFLIHCFCTNLLFRYKRLRNGMPFIQNIFDSFLPTATCVAILYSFLLMKNNAGNNPIFIKQFYFTLFFGILFIIYWRTNITRTYHDKRRDRDLDILNEHLDELKADYQKMTEDKDELAKIVHRDNKLVPAMLLSVESFLIEFPNATPQMKKRGAELMAELSKEAEGRKGILLKQDKRCSAKIVAVGIPALDDVLKYMQEKAISKDISLSASADLGIADLVTRTIDDKDLSTLAVDLLENAIIACSYNHGTNVYFVIGFYEKHLAIHVYDSGIPFTKEVLLDLGIIKRSTHEDAGGSGIGLMTIWELMHKYRASYIIDEYDTYAGPYTKRISIIFDKHNKYILNTSRPKEEIDFLRQRADLIIETRKESVAR